MFVGNIEIEWKCADCNTPDQPELEEPMEPEFDEPEPHFDGPDQEDISDIDVSKEVIEGELA